MKNLLDILEVIKLSGDQINSTDHSCFAPHHERKLSMEPFIADDADIMDDNCDDDDDST